MKKELPTLASIDTSEKFKLWLATDLVIEQGSYDYDEFYELLKAHFNQMSRWQ